MNILIIGGLLVLAVVAIVGAVLLGIGEERAEKQRAAEKAAQLLQAQEESQPAKTARTTTVLAPAISETPTSTMPTPTFSNDVSTPKEMTPVLDERGFSSAYHNGSLLGSAFAEEQTLTIPISQFYAMTGELHALRQRASELEQHLDRFTEVLESLAHLQDDETMDVPLVELRGVE